MKKLILFSLVAGLILSVSCSKNENANSYAAGGALPTNYVSILDDGFSPASLRVSNGSSITFLNSTNITHTLVSNDSVMMITTPINPAKSYVYKKYFVGTMPYHCIEHPSERGIIEQIP